MLALLNYQSDLGRNYTLIALGLTQKSELSSDKSTSDLLALMGISSYIELKSGVCAVSGLTPRKIRVFLADNSVYEVNYPIQFDAALITHLDSESDISGYQLIGERIKHYRVQKTISFLNG
jgi:hypothetical protein